MRERIIRIIVLIVAVLLAIFGTLYFTRNNNQVQTTGTHKNVTVTENDSLNESIKKVYNAVVVVSIYQGDNLYGSGSGFVYKKQGNKGYILTNYHVVEEALKTNTDSIKVTMMNGEETPAKYLGGDSVSDVAVLQIDGSKVIEVAEIGNNANSKIGDTVFTVGTPVDSEYMGTVTKGILSYVNRTITVDDENKGSYMVDVLQTDASINPGNSGGPLVNIDGQVIGITSMKLVTTQIEGMGFAVPIEVPMANIDKLEKGQKIERPYIGISLIDVTNTAYLNYYNIKVPSNIKSGIVIMDVENGSAAAESNLQKGDIVIKADGETIKSAAHFKYILYKHTVGDQIKLTVVRNGREQEITLKLTKTQ